MKGPDNALLLIGNIALPGPVSPGETNTIHALPHNTSGPRGRTKVPGRLDERVSRNKTSGHIPQNPWGTLNLRRILGIVSSEGKGQEEPNTSKPGAIIKAPVSSARPCGVRININTGQIGVQDVFEAIQLSTLETPPPVATGGSCVTTISNIHKAEFWPPL